MSTTTSQESLHLILRTPVVPGAPRMPQASRLWDLYLAMSPQHYRRCYTFPRTPPTPAGTSLARPIYAPIRRLPTEIFVRIFLLHSDAFTPAFRTPFPTQPSYEVEAELDRLANTHLLTLSRVCGHWHHIVINTPALWSTFNLNGVLWSSSYHLEKTMVLLAAGLERSRNMPIEVSIFDESVLPLPRRVFELLAHHCHRWKAAEFYCVMESIDLSVLRGRLSVQKLEIDLRPMPHAIGFLVDTFQLETLVLPSSLLAKIGPIPFEQLTDLACERVGPPHLTRAISAAAQLSHGSHFHLSAVGEDSQSFPVCIPPKMSAISRFSCRLVGNSYTRQAYRGLGSIFASLSLPNLEEMWLTSIGYPKIISEWSHAQFCELSERSGFHRSLKVLRIAEILITEEDLISVLSSLTSLEYLEIADKHRVDGEGADLVVLTDDFLRAVTFQPGRRLIPRLCHFTCASQLQFTDHIFVMFVASRLEVCSSCAFRVEICTLVGGEGTAALPALLHELRVQSNSRFDYDYTSEA
ncbi:hypothetical protein C8F04DRAFT_269265 [Mycena alexandri]|uniref:F-box domain-containing protein n=1 Tax=Mycena alexandri TaxID=1745969 RepID=A0AAD6S539_9AGAR|nr:hypothetical protein C8F04DRAFT_269265 [Mycena alexandri]